MTTTATDFTVPRLADEPLRSIPLHRLVAVELRKQVNTRAGRWLLIVVGLVIATVLAIMFVVNRGHHPFADYLSSTYLPLTMAVPIIGVLAATSEWSQHTGLTTFALEPRRGRVVTAKGVAAVVSGVAVMVVSVALAAAAHGGAVLFRDAPADWSLPWKVAAALALIAVVSVVQGVAFGLASQSTPIALVGLLVIPTVWSVIGTMVSGLRDWLPWLDLGTATTPFFDGVVHARDWAHLGTASLIWVGLPLLVGVSRTLRSEVK